MATAEAVGEDVRSPGRVDRFGAWLRWWFVGTGLDWGFVALSAALIAAGYYDAWLNRNAVPIPSWEHAPTQAAWAAVTLYLAVWAFIGLRQGRSLDRAVPESYGTAVAGSVVFLSGMVLDVWWRNAFGPDHGVPAIFRPTNLLQIGGAALMVTGPLRASVGRGELMAGPTAVLSAALLLAAVTFFTQFDHPYIDDWARGSSAPTFPNNPLAVGVGNPWDAPRAQALAALGLMMQTAAVTGVILWTLRQTRLPVGSITLMLTITGFLTATQYGKFPYVLVAFAAGVTSEVALIIARPRADRDLAMRLFAVTVGALLSGLYLAYLFFGPGTWLEPDMALGTIVACALVGGLMSYVIFPGSDAQRAASVLWPAQGPDSSPTAPDVTVERVEHALKVLHSTRDLGESPLVGLRCVASPNAAALRQTIEAAIEHLKSSTFQLDAQAGEILYLYYVRRIGGGYAVYTRVGLSRAVYFNRRSYGVRRLVDRLRELEEPASPA
jgi:hypothetical protein